MFCTWRATVCSLMTSADGDLAVALAGWRRRRSTSSSRGVSPCVGAVRRPSESSEAMSGAAPSSSKRRSGRVELERERLLVAERAARQPHEHTGARQPRRAPRAPARPAAACRRVRARVPASPPASSTAPRACASSAPSISLSHRAAISSSSAQAPRASSASPTASMISTQAGSRLARLRRLGGLAEHASDRRGSRVAVSLREPQQRQARLRLAAEPARFPVRRPRPPRTRPAGDRPRPADSTPWPRRPGSSTSRSDAFARSRLLERVRPRAVQLHDLGAVHEAPAGERHQVGLLLAPALQRSRPLPGAAQVVDLLAGQRSRRSRRSP